uniref:Ig-like domain-containing protein n=1 Tax=Sphaeramia orbicularis TaxID=375764 RepID=A0A672ZYT5_9TELE
MFVFNVCVDACMHACVCVCVSSCSRYVFHSAGIFPDPLYQGRVEFQGGPGTHNCSLRISDLRPSDSGTYVFYAVVDHPTQKMPEQRGVQLLVADSSGTVGVLGPSSDVTVGGAITLSCCSLPVNPEAQVTWYKTTEAEPMHSGKAWSIRRATWDDSGSYYCQIQSRGRVQNSTQIRVDVQYAPRHTTVFIWPPEELPVALTCSSDANPAVAAFTWYQDAACNPTADLSFYQGRRTAATPTATGHTLSSVNITADANGLYCCVARNKHGWEKYTVEVKRSPAETSSSSGGKLIIVIIVTVAALLAVIAIAAFFMLRKQRSSRHHSYVLTETTSSAPACWRLSEGHGVTDGDKA